MHALIHRVRSIDPYVVAVFSILTAALGLSMKAILIKLAYRVNPELDAITLLAVRYAFTLPLILCITWIMRKQYAVNPINKKDAFKVFALGVLGYYFSSLLDFTGLKYITAGLERLILFVYPTFVVIIVVVFFREKISLSKLVAIVVSYSGIALVFSKQIHGEQLNLVLGAGLILLAAISFAVFTVGSSNLIKRVGAIRFTTYAMATACALALLHSMTTHKLAIANLSHQEYTIALTMAVFSTVLPFYLTSFALKHLTASTVSVMSTASPAVTLFMAWLVLNETMDATQIFGSMVVMLGVYLASRKKSTAE